MERKLLTFCYWLCEACHRALHWLVHVENACANASVYFYNLRVDLDKEREEEKLQDKMSRLRVSDPDDSCVDDYAEGERL